MNEYGACVASSFLGQIMKQSWGLKVQSKERHRHTECTHDLGCVWLEIAGHKTTPSQWRLAWMVCWRAVFVQCLCSVYCYFVSVQLFCDSLLWTVGPNLQKCWLAAAHQVDVLWTDNHNIALAGSKSQAQGISFGHGKFLYNICLVFSLPIITPWSVCRGRNHLTSNKWHLFHNTSKFMKS